MDAEQGQQGRRHVSDQAWEAFTASMPHMHHDRTLFEKTRRNEGTVLLTVAEVEAMEAECEQLRVQLAGCGVAAMCNTRESMTRHAVQPGDYGYSASYGDVVRAVEREVTLREELERMTQAVGLLTTLHPTMEIDVSDPIGMAHKIIEYVNELLRGVQDADSNGAADSGEAAQAETPVATTAQDAKQGAICARALLWTGQGDSVYPHMSHRLGLGPQEGG